ncbi:MAG: hypothetical protein ACJAS0_000285 [Alcanivorax borkumensis]|jgi:hypothetical protein
MPPEPEKKSITVLGIVLPALNLGDDYTYRLGGKSICLQAAQIKKWLNICFSFYIVDFGQSFPGAFNLLR